MIWTQLEVINASFIKLCVNAYNVIFNVIYYNYILNGK